MNMLFDRSKTMLLKQSPKFGEINCGIFKQQNTKEYVAKEYLISWENNYAIYYRKVAKYKLKCKTGFQIHSIKYTYLRNYFYLWERGDI